MTAQSILRHSFTPSKQHITRILLDFIWRFLWTVLSTIIVLFFSVSLMAQLSSIEWEGPDLGASNPIIMLAALRQFWQMYGAVLLAAFGFLLLALIVLWIVLEALFRGGRKGFWIYLGTGAARTAILLGLAAILGALSLRDESRGTFLIGAVVMVGMWFFVSWIETVVRRDAVELFAVDFLTLWAVSGVTWAAEAIIAFILWGSAASVLIRASEPPEAALTFFLIGLVVTFWLVVHSYLIAVRYLAIDIMRSNVVRS